MEAVTEISILSVAIKPSDCVLAFGIPVTTDFNHNIAIDNCRSDPHRFINQTPTGRPLGRAEYELILPEDRVEAIRAVGVRVETEVDSMRLSQLMLSSHKVVVLFTHWHGSAIELYDGFAECEIILGMIPAKGPSKIIDLSICNPDNLAMRIKNKRQDFAVRYSSSRVNARRWLDMLLTLFRVLGEDNLTYAQGWERAVSQVVHA